MTVTRPSSETPWVEFIEEWPGRGAPAALRRGVIGCALSCVGCAGVVALSKRVGGSKRLARMGPGGASSR